MLVDKEWVGIQLRRARVPRLQDEIVRESNSLGVQITQSRLSTLERGQAEMRLDELKAFCQIFNVDYSYFLGDLSPGRAEATEQEARADTQDGQKKSASG